MGYYLIQINGQTLIILWVFSSVEKIYHCNFLATVHRRKSSHLMASSHSGFSRLYHYNLQGSCLQTVIQPLVETAGLLISWVFSFLSWVFSFLPRTIPTSTDQRGGSLLVDHPHGYNHLYSQSTDWGWFLKTYPRVWIFTYSPRTGTRSKCLQNPWGMTLTMEPPQTPSRWSGFFLFYHDIQTNTHGYYIHGFIFFPTIT